MDFLPQDYEAPKQNNHYMKLEEGENKIRILSKPILGWEDWKDKKPVRFHFNEKPKNPVDSTKPIRHFWAFIVYNYAKDEIQILHVTQSMIRKGIEALCRDSDWGSPHAYDLKITKKGEGMNTEYSINPVPHKPISEEIKRKFKDKKCNLDALFTNADPFANDHTSYTPMLCDENSVSISTVSVISEEQYKQLEEYIFDNPDLQEKIRRYLKDKVGHEDIKKMPFAYFEGFLKEAKNQFENKQDLFSA